MADGPSHTDLSTLWIPLMPETSKLPEAMEKAGKDATESFSKGTSGLGEKIHGSLSKGTEKVKDVFAKAGSDAGKSMTDAFSQGSGGIDAAAKSAGQRAGKSISDGLAASSSGVGQWAAQFGEQIGTKLGGAIGGALKDIPAIGGAADALQKVGGKAKELGDDFAKSKDQFKGLSDAFAGFNKDAPGLEGHLGKIGGILGQATGAVAAWTSLFHLMDKYGDKIEHLPGMGTLNDIFSAPGDAGAWLHDHLGLPTLPVDPRYKKPAPPLGTFSGVPLDDLTLGKGAGGDGYGALSGGGGPMGSSSDGYGALSGAKTSSGWFSGGLPGPVVPRDVGSDKGLTPTSQSVKKVVSSLFPQINDIGGWRPPDGYNEHSSGQALDVMIPNANSPQGKALGDQISQYVLAHAKELGVDYTIWQHGQHNPDGSFQYYPDRGGPTQNHMDHVHIHTVRGGGSGSPSDLLASGGGGGIPDSFGGGSSAGFGGGGGPSGTPDNPIFVAFAGGGGGSGGGGSGGGSLGGSFASGGGSGGAQMPNFLSGAMQLGGLDGSVFHTFGGASNPMDFGAVKIGTGLLKSFAPMLGGRGSGPNNLAAGDARIKFPLPGITPASGHGPGENLPHLVPNPGSGGGGAAAASMGPGPGGAVSAGINAAINLGGAAFSDFFNPGPVIPAPDRDLGGGTGALPWSAGGPQDPVGRGVSLPGMTPSGAPTPPGQGAVTHNITNNTVDNSFTVNGGGQGETAAWKPQYNAAQNRYGALTAGLPSSG